MSYIKAITKSRIFSCFQKNLISYPLNFKPQILPLTYSSGLVILMKQQNHGELDGSHRNKCSLLSVNNDNQTLKTPERNQSIFRRKKVFFNRSENLPLLWKFSFIIFIWIFADRLISSNMMLEPSWLYYFSNRFNLIMHFEKYAGNESMLSL